MNDNKQIKLVAFDMDGTMLDNEWAHARANEQIARELGVELPQNVRPCGYSVREYWQSICQNEGIQADVEQLAQQHFQKTMDVIKEAKVPEMPGLGRVLRSLKESGRQVAITSSSDESFVREVADYLGVTPYIDFFVTKDQVTRLKPAPDIYLEALRLAGVKAEQALGVEDSVPGCRALREAGLHSVGFLNEGSNFQGDRLESDYRIERMDELYTLVENL